MFRPLPPIPPFQFHHNTKDVAMCHIQYYLPTFNCGLVYLHSEICIAILLSFQYLKG